ncbi:hypothetical protein P5673_004465 [Acropora cervicornis]|uniref:Uncharacterized protein n=1 Tax=Acropora cervicornis TaxID=6130 RepID=A0AAD9R117_ACRCE|nr:hypothetical protein P5673_004465 [Acropora cervicornis]
MAAKERKEYLLTFKGFCLGLSQVKSSPLYGCLLSQSWWGEFPCHLPFPYPHRNVDCFQSPFGEG